MLFNGLNFSGGSNSYSSTPTGTFQLKKTYLQNAIYDYIHIFDGLFENDMNDNSETKVTEWQNNTVLLALFNGNLSGGNLDVDMSNIVSVRIKKKESSQLNSKYITIFEKPITTTNDMGFVVYDKYAKAKTNYTYAVCPVLADGTEGELFEVDVYSDFNGVVICDKDNLYSTFVEVEYSVNKNQNNAVVTTLENKYPYVIHNDIAEYYSGTLSAMWIGWKECAMDFDNSIKYRKEFSDWLNNGEAKILKFDDGREWLVNITGNINERNNDHELKVITSFDWTEIGDYNSIYDLYDTGLIDSDPYVYN